MTKHLLFFLIFILLSCDTKLQVEKITKIEANATQLTFDGNEKFHLSWEPCGNRIAYATERFATYFNAYSIYGEDLGAFSQPGNIERISNIGLSRDASKIVFRDPNNGDLTVQSLLEFEVTTYSYPYFYSPRFYCWSPDDQQIAMATWEEIFILSLKSHQITEILKVDSWKIISGLSWSPDSKSILYAIDEMSEGHIWLMNLGTDNKRVITPDSIEACLPDWSPDGQKIVFLTVKFGSNECKVSVIDTSNNYLITDILEDDSLSSPRWSPDGTKIAYNKGYGKRISIIDENGASLHSISNSLPFTRYFWHPDGDKIITFGRFYECTINLISTIDYRMVPVTNGLNSDKDEFPVWLPETSDLIYLKDNLFWAVFNSGSTKKLWESADNSTKRNVDISPDGSQIIYDDRRDIYLQSIRGGNPINVTEKITEKLTHPTYSPNGKQIACCSRDGLKIFTLDNNKLIEDMSFAGNYTNPDWGQENAKFGSHIAVEINGSIYIISPNSWSPELVISDGTEPCWSPDGTKIAFVRNNNIY
ncbi:MAG: hypothetical protein GF353_23810, partial [Candidatus Lokiarchaeota archaeon]|nr:hypothetical protein [Candidatus Lokiarchaeota archaeon]